MINWVKQLFSIDVFRRGPAAIVVLNDGEVIENAEVIIYSNGMVNITNMFEDTTLHISQCQVTWTFSQATEGDKGITTGKIVKMKAKQPSGSQ